MKRHICAVPVILVILGQAQVSQADEQWPQFRGPDAKGVSEGSDLPIRWSETENVMWNTEIPGLGWSSPIVWNDSIYLTSVVSGEPVEEPLGGLYRGRETWLPSTAEHRWLVYALDVETGAIRWAREVHSGVPTHGHHLKNSLASETPITDGESVFVYFGNVGVFALDTNGTLQWSYELKASNTRLEWGTASSPILWDDQLFVINDNDDQSYLLALSAETGAELWRSNRDEGTNWSTPYIWDNELRTEIITTGSDRVRSYGS